MSEQNEQVSNAAVNSNNTADQTAKETDKGGAGEASAGAKGKGKESKKSLLLKLKKILGIFKSKKFKIIAGSLAGAVIFTLSGYFIIDGISLYNKRAYEAVIVSSFKAIEEGDVHKGESILMEATSSGDRLAASLLAWVEAKKGNFNKALEYARYSHDDENKIGAFEVLGDLALLGYGNATGAGAAMYYFNEEIERLENLNSEIDPAKKMKEMLENAIGLCQNMEDYIRIVSESERYGSSLGLLYRGDIEFLGEQHGISPKSALKTWEQSLNMGRIESITRTAGTIWNGYGIQRSYVKAIKLYKTAAQEGEKIAMYNLGLIALRTGKEGSRSEAMRYFKASAREGYGPAMSAVAVLSMIQYGIDDKEAARAAAQLFKRAHEVGDITGSVFYILCLFSGVGVPVDTESALAILYDIRVRDFPSVNGFLHYFTYNSEKNMRPLLEQQLKLCALQYDGSLHFRIGAFEGDVYHNNKSTITYFVKPWEDTGVSELERQAIGKNYIKRIDMPDEVLIDDEPLFFPEMAYVLIESEPTTGAKPYLPAKVVALNPTYPVLPQDFDEYSIDFEAVERAFEL
ncbi:MAG: sel1 repeat family protein [Succinivibrio sp.]|nr:sel1 repeat family protein [Succinivibrio sp.]